MSDSKRIKQGRAKRNRVDATDELTKAAKADDMAAGSETADEVDRKMMERENDILDNPMSYFRLDDPARDEAWLAFCGPPDHRVAKKWLGVREWMELIRHVYRMERSKPGEEKDGAASGVYFRPGKVWQHKGVLVDALDGSPLAKEAPPDSLRMFFVREKHHWRLHTHLRELALIKLGIPQPPDEDHASLFRAGLMEQRSRADFFAGAKDTKIQARASQQLADCDKLLSAFDAAENKALFANYAQPAMWVAAGDQWIRLISQEAVRIGVYNTRGHKKPHLQNREWFEKAFLSCVFRNGVRPSRDEVIKEIKKSQNVRCTGEGDGRVYEIGSFKIRIHHADKMLSRIKADYYFLLR